VKSSNNFSRVALAGLSAAALSLSLAGCGQKGPLYLAKPPEHVIHTAPAADNTGNAGNTSGAAAPATTATPAK